MSEGTESTLQYELSGETLNLTGDGLDAALQRTDYASVDDLSGVWVVDAENGGIYLVAMDKKGGTLLRSTLPPARLQRESTLLNHGDLY